MTASFNTNSGSFGQAAKTEETQTNLSASTQASAQNADSTKAALSTPDSSVDTDQSDNVQSGSHDLSIVPKGIRSFDTHDSDFYLQLIPGARDRHGLPESIRFWKMRLEERRRDKTLSIGLLYGPSGCGKSSLVQTGLIPRLAPHVQTLFVEANSSDVEERLRVAIRAQCPTLPRNRSLVDLIKMIRNGFGPAEGEKVLIVIDQFEQWLHAYHDNMSGTLVQALRQCGGARVQTLLLVRDDFGMAATAFMREVEVRIAEGHNAAAVQLFPVRLAINVLAACGRAFDVLPPEPEQMSDEHRAFLKKAATDLAQDDKIVCVRLALFAEMMKARPWTFESSCGVEPKIDHQNKKEFWIEPLQAQKRRQFRHWNCNYSGCGMKC